MRDEREGRTAGGDRAERGDPARGAVRGEARGGPLSNAMAALTLTAAVLFLLALARALTATLAHEYLVHGFTHTPLLLLVAAIEVLALPVVAAAAVALGAVGILARRAAAPPPAVLALRVVPAVVTIAIFLRFAYVTNRFGLSYYWLHRKPLLGMDLPVALVTGEVWIANLLALGKAVAVGAAAWLAMRLVFGPGARRATGLWRRAAHPGALALVAAPLVAAPLLLGTPRPDRALPSILLISIDTLRADHLSCYGYERETSPALDALAREGILFENCVSPAPNTPPAHMSLFTSLYPTVHGFTGEGDRLAAWRLTLAEYLREAGYRTAATTDGGYMRGWFGFGQGFDRYQDRLKGFAGSSVLVQEWLDGPLADDPFFLFVHGYDVHSPYDPPEPYRSMFTDPDYDGDFYPGSQELETIRRRINADSTATHGLSPADVRHMIDRYDGGIRYADHVLGELFDVLRARGVLDRTWVIVTSDHGEEMTEHGSVLHETLYRTVTHVPLIVRPPGGLAEGRRVDEVVELTDLMPTLLELAEIPPAVEQPLQGASLLAFLRGQTPAAWDGVAYSEHPWRGKRRAITRADVHVLTSLAHGEIEVYAYPEDPLEQVDLAGALATTSSAMPADTVRAAMRALIEWNEAQTARVASTRGGTEALARDRRTTEELRALGYLQ